MGDFGSVLKQLRAAFGLRQDELAQKLGISRSRIGMYETGQREPDFETLEKLADFFNVDVDYLLGRTSKTTMTPSSVYYTNPETARLAQEMFDDPDMRSLFSMKRNMDPKEFKNYMDFMKAQYRLEHPED